MAGDDIEIEVVYGPAPGHVDRCTVRLSAGSNVADALQASGVLQRHGLAVDKLKVGVWCLHADPTTVLRDRDRVEIYRPLTVDPKEARRLRYKREKSAAKPAKPA